MTSGERGRATEEDAAALAPVLDHAGLFVADMERAAAALERLGFALTPFARQVAPEVPGGPLRPQGTANRCAMLRRGYLEVLTPVADTPLAAEMRAALARYEGAHLIAFATAAPAAQHARLAEAGFSPRPLLHMTRPASDDPGAPWVAFTVLRVPPEAMPEGRIQFMRHETPAVMWQPERVAQPNGAEALTGVLLCVADPAGAGARFARFTGQLLERAGGLPGLTLARGWLAFATTAQAQALLPGLDAPAPPFMAAVAMACADTAATEAWLRAADVPVHRLDAQRLWVPPVAPLRSGFLFHAPGLAALWPVPAQD